MTQNNFNTEGKKMHITREFSAPLETVWKAWTDSSVLDQWWAPKPYKATTKIMDFKSGGYWLFCMEGPDGSKNWCRADYKTVDPLKSFSYVDSFCDENGKITEEFPGMSWRNEFHHS